MINTLVIANYKVEKHGYGKTDTSDFSEIYKSCIASYSKNLKDLDEVMTFGGKVATYHDMFKTIFLGLRDMQMKGERNIVFVDADTLCVKPTEIFDKHQGFNMFLNTPGDMYHDAYPKKVPKGLYKDLTPWFLSNVRYYPADMDDALWDTVSGLYNQWINVWAYECIIWNAMLHAQCQGMTYYEIRKDYHRPWLNHQYQIKNFKNEVGLEDAHIIHFHSSRDSVKTKNIMSDWRI